jgi:hypothetical protein
MDIAYGSFRSYSAECTDPQPGVIIRIHVMGKNLTLARVIWVAVAVLAVGLAVATLPDLIHQAAIVAPPDERSFSQLSPAELSILNQLGLPVGLYVAFVVAWTLSPLLVYIVIASFIFQRSTEPGAAFWMSLMLVGVGAALPFLGGITEFQPVWQTAIYFARAQGLWLLFSLFFVFPDGRFVPRWTRALTLLWAAWMLFWLAQPQSPWAMLDAAGAITPFGLVVTLLGFGAGVYAQAYRYRREASALQRQQAKVFAFGFGATFTLYMAAIAPYILWPAVRAPGWPYFVYGLLYVPLLTRLAYVLVPLIIGFAVLRYRLWDIDLIIRRTLIYGLVTTALAAVYAGTVVALQPVFALITGQRQSQLSTVISTLAIAALFGPLRGGIQRAIDRRFYRRKYDAGQALAAFSGRLMEEVDVSHLSAQLVEVVGDTLQPTHVSLWLAPTPVRLGRSDRAEERGGRPGAGV